MLLIVWNGMANIREFAMNMFFPGTEYAYNNGVTDDDPCMLKSWTHFMWCFRWYLIENHLIHWHNMPLVIAYEWQVLHETNI